jgi:predicted nucleic acid-binding protein
MTERMVIDASVAAKWFLDLELHAPQVFRPEVCSLLTKACLTRVQPRGDARLRKQNAINDVQDLFRFPIEIHETTVDNAVEALEIAVTYHKLYNDMTYLCLAQRLDCPWCTADEKFFKAIPPGFPSQHVLRLSSLRKTYGTTADTRRISAIAATATAATRV